MSVTTTYVCQKCGAKLASYEEHSGTAGCLGSGFYTSTGPMIWGSEQGRRLVRYDEATEIIKEFVSRGMALDVVLRAQKFLNEEPKE